MKYLIFFSLLTSSIYAQYLDTELTEVELDPKPIVKDMGDAPRPEVLTTVDESRRSGKEGIKREPAVIPEVKTSTNK